MVQLSVRRETEFDFKAVANIHERAFNSSGESKLVNLLRNTEAFVPELSIVAEATEKIVGHILFSKVSLLENGIDLNCISLAPVAVLPEFQQMGIGSKLIREGMQKARVLGFKSILVLGNPNYYGKFGFKNELTANIHSEYSSKNFLGFELYPNSLSVIKNATVIYPKAFSVVE